MTTSARRPAGRWLRRFAFALVALLALAAAGEVLLRLGEPDGPKVVLRSGDPGAQDLEKFAHAELLLNNHIVYASDPELGALLAPNREDVVETADHTYTLRTDHAGFPNPEPWPAKSDVVVLGNSLLIGPGVGMEGQFTTLLDQRLGDRTVLNLGLPGGGTEHELLLYRRFAKPLHPGLVVNTLWVLWDVDNSMQFSDWQKEGKPDPDYTHYRGTYGETHGDHRHDDVSAESADSRGGGALAFVRHQLGRSRLVRAVFERVQAVGDPPDMAQVVRFPNGRDVVLSARNQEILARGIARAGHPDMEDIFFGPLEQLRDEVEQDGGRFVVVLIPSKEEVYGADESPRILRTIDEVKAGLESRGLPILDLYPVIRERGQVWSPFYPVDIHLDPLGNEIVADAIAQWIEGEGVFDDR